jgi:hypothetical protein
MRHPALGHSGHVLHGEYFECQVCRGTSAVAVRGLSTRPLAFERLFVRRLLLCYMSRFSPGPDEHPGQYSRIVGGTSFAIKQILCVRHILYIIDDRAFFLDPFSVWCPCYQA